MVVMRVMALLYLGASPVYYDFEQEYYLSPVVAPDWMLEKFPKTFFLTGEKDPLVDDTVIFAGRLRKVKEARRNAIIRQRAERQKEKEMSQVNVEEGYSTDRETVPKRIDTKKFKVGVRIKDNEEELDFKEMKNTENLNGHSVKDKPNSSTNIVEEEEGEDLDQQWVRVKILEGISHAFFNMYTFLPEARQAVELTSDWFKELISNDAEEREFEIGSVAEEDVVKRRLNELANVHLGDK